jgi:hypothetical protein
MWNDLKNWHRAIIIFFVSFLAIYFLGRLFVPIQVVDSFENYKWPAIAYSVFLVLPILILKYSHKKFVKIFATVVAVVFLLIVLLPTILNWSEFYKNSISLSRNTIFATLSILYVAPLNGGLILVSILSGGM